MSKRGVSKIAGNPAPAAGTASEYTVEEWYPATPLQLRDPSRVIWELFKKRANGTFTSTGIRKKGSGIFTFGEVSSKHTYRLEAYLYHPEGSGPTTLEIRPQPAASPKITKVELLHIDSSPGNRFSFTDRLIARAHSVSLVGQKILFTLWEDDVAGPGHHASNLVIDRQEALVQRDGTASVSFMLSKALVKKVLQGERDPRALEFYVTAEYYTHQKQASCNVGVKNPLIFGIPRKTQSSPPASAQISKAKGSPASDKPASKKEEKRLLEKFSDGIEELWDWQETKGTIEKDRKPVVQKKEGKSVTIVKSINLPKPISPCLCKKYNLIWGSKIGCNERKKVIEISESLGVDANWLMTIIALETAETFRPSIDNGVGYVGLIQFGSQAAAAAIGTTQDKLVKMNFIQQMNYVEKHLITKRAKYKTLADLYLAVLYPKACGHGSERDYVVLHGNAYQNNPLFFKEKGEWEYVTKINKKGKKFKKKVSTNPDGNTYVWEVALVAHEVYTKGLSFKENNFICDVSGKIININNKCPEDCSQCFDYADVIPNPKINNQSGNVNKNRFHRIPRYNSTHPKGYYHTGTDILSNGKFVEIHSLLCGEVVETVTLFRSQEYRQNSMGNTITIKSKDKEGMDVWIIYCHLDCVKVKKGQKIKHGQVIGISGCTGNAGLKPDGSRGIEIKYWHIHIEASRENKFFGSSKRIDAEQFMKTKFDGTNKGNPTK